MAMSLLLALGTVAIAVAVLLALSSVRRSVEARLGTTDAELRRLAEAAATSQRGSLDLRLEMVTLKQTFDRLQQVQAERRAREERAWDDVHRISSVLAGSQRTGRAGENLLGEALAHLPPALLERDFRVNGRVVEFALVLPDGRRLPIDSKWPAEREVAALADATDQATRERAVQLIERTVVRRAREVAGYRDPALTAPVAVAAVPDAAYAVLRRAHVEAYRQGVVVVPYSMALPVVLSLHALTARLGAVGDVQACLADLGLILDGMEATLENKLERASTMLANGTGELRSHVGRARSSLSRAAREDPAADGQMGPEAEDARPRLVPLTS